MRPIFSLLAIPTLCVALAGPASAGSPLTDIKVDPSSGDVQLGTWGRLSIGGALMGVVADKVTESLSDKPGGGLGQGAAGQAGSIAGGQMPQMPQLPQVPSVPGIQKPGKPSLPSMPARPSVPGIRY